ncbi:MAG: membrane protease subunit HflK [Puniceicoccaceae bacterium 5H]|nr:MAG: membrane protease subunit HflK [Puniceicoccaceae bacterium 5H]
MRRKQRQNQDGLMVQALLLTLKNLKPAAFWVFLLLLGLYLVSGIRTVGPSETGLLLRFGKLQPKTYDAGLVFSLPEPFDEVVLVQTGTEHSLTLESWASGGKKIGDPDREYQYTMEEVQAWMDENGGNMPPPKKVQIDGATTLDPVVDGYTLTGDRNILQARFTLRYRIHDPVAYFRLGDRRDELIGSLLYQSASHTIGQMRIDDCLTEKRDAMIGAIEAHAQARADALQLGITLTACELQELGPPRQVLAAFEDVINAQMFAKTLLENAREYRTNSLTQAGGQAAAIRRRAEAYANDLLAKSEGEAEAFKAFYAEYQTNPDAIVSRLYLDSLDYVMQQAQSSALFGSEHAQPTLFIEPSPKYTR